MFLVKYLIYMKFNIIKLYKQNEKLNKNQNKVLYTIFICFFFV